MFNEYALVEKGQMVGRSLWKRNQSEDNKKQTHMSKGNNQAYLTRGIHCSIIRKCGSQLKSIIAVNLFILP
jgi:hypothetical protein